ncbi:MAG: fatty acid desaturase [Acidobacteriota bacterium]
MQNVVAFEPVRESIKWKNVAIFTVFHLLAIPAFFTFSWQNLVAFLIVYWIVISLGVGLGWHRLLTHRSFKAPKWLEYTLTVFGSMSLQDPSNNWVATHRIHHAFTEEEGDPHSTRRGFWWAQSGWILWGTGLDHDEATMKRYVPDLLKDRFHVLISRYFYVPLIISAVILFALGGWTMVVWGVFLRTVIGWHTTWFVNSLAHLYGKRPHATTDDSTNNWFVAILTFGEGWHNNHHAFPTSARHGLKWYQFDMNWITIRVFERLGWAEKIRLIDTARAATELKQAV